MDQESLFRVFFVIVMVGNIGVSAYFRRRARQTEEISRGLETKGLQVARVVFTLPLLIAILSYASYPRAIAWAAVPIGPEGRWLGVGLGLALMPWMVSVFRAIGSNVSETVLLKKSHQLVTAGPYRWVRHPIYTTGILMIVAIGLISANSIFLVIAVLAYLLFLIGIVPREEAALIERFGGDYESYRKTTGALLPRLWSRR